MIADASVCGWAERDHVRLAGVEAEPDAQGAQREREQAGRAVAHDDRRGIGEHPQDARMTRSTARMI